jgi:hypothetical protein
MMYVKIVDITCLSTKHACVSNVRVIELSEKWGYYDG